MIDWLQNEWQQLTLDWDTEISNTYWEEILAQYTQSSRYYHNLTHLHAMFSHLKAVETKIEDLKLVKFAIWYHDIIYKSSKSNNEEKSAELAQKRLKNVNFDEKSLEIVQKLIISTKKHIPLITENKDNNYLLDLDLSVLGSNWETYKLYFKNIRKEYRLYPNFLYNKGRKKVLQTFLERDTLFYTEYFKSKLENQARANLKQEISLL